MIFSVFNLRNRVNSVSWAAFDTLAATYTQVAIDCSHIVGQLDSLFGTTAHTLATANAAHRTHLARRCALSLIAASHPNGRTFVVDSAHRDDSLRTSLRARFATGALLQGYAQVAFQTSVAVLFLERT